MSSVRSDAGLHASTALCRAAEQAVQEEGLDLQLTPSQGQCLCRALDMLERGHSKRFEDELWLGFGNDWWPLREMLVRGGYVRRLGGMRDELVITARGSHLREQLAGEVSMAS